MPSTKRQRTNGGAVVLLNGAKGGSTLYNESVVLECHEGAVLSARFNHDGSKIVSCGMDRSIQLWNTPIDEKDTEPNYGAITGHKAAVTSVNWMADESMIMSGSADSTVGFWDCETGKRIRKCSAHTSVVNQISISPEYLGTSVGDDGFAYIWDPREKLPVSKIKTDFPLLSATYNNAGDTLYIGGIEPVIRAFDVRAMDKELWQCGGQNDTITSIAINKDDSILLSRSMNGEIRTYSARSFIPEGIARLNPNVYSGAPSGKEFYLIRACFNNDSTALASGSEDKTVTTFEFLSRKIQDKYDGHLGTVLDVDYHPLDPVMLSTSTDGNIIVREI